MKIKGCAKVFIIGGLLLIAAALCLTVYNIVEQEKAAFGAANILQQMEVAVISESETNDESVETEAEIPEHLRNPDMAMPEIIIDGERYIGVLHVPALELSLPIISEWSYQRLKIAPCRYVGSVYAKDMVIMAHNYTSHFGSLGELKIDDEVYFEDMEGNIFSYHVVELEILGGTDVEDMVAGDWDLTLFTCTIGGKSRVTVRCKQSDK